MSEVFRVVNWRSSSARIVLSPSKNWVVLGLPVFLASQQTPGTVGTSSTQSQNQTLTTYQMEYAQWRCRPFTADGPIHRAGAGVELTELGLPLYVPASIHAY